MTTRDEPQAVREIHEIRERIHDERKDWTPTERREHRERVGQEIAKKLGLPTIPHRVRKSARKSA